MGNRRIGTGLMLLAVCLLAAVPVRAAGGALPSGHFEAMSQPLQKGPSAVGEAEQVEDAVRQALEAAKAALAVADRARQVANSPGAEHLTWPSGHEYYGEASGGYAAGLGVMTYPTGSVYAGERHDANGRSGYGVEDYSAGDRYEGQFANDVRQGYGVFYYADGSRYMGQFHDDVRHGIGRYVFADGRILAGRWEADQLVSP